MGFFEILELSVVQKGASPPDLRLNVVGLAVSAGLHTPIFLVLHGPPSYRIKYSESLRECDRIGPLNSP